MTTDKPNEPTDYTAATLAQAAGIGKSYVARLCRNGALPCTRIGHVWLIRYDVAQQWLAARKAKLDATES
jgi:excisionase family DNA binding protein